MSVSYPPDQALYGASCSWSLESARARPTIDPATLARAIETVMVEPNLDWRTLQLAKEGWQALEESIEPRLLNDYLQDRTSIQIAEAIRARIDDPWNSHCEVRFSSLKERLMPHLSPTTIRQFLRELGTAILTPPQSPWAAPHPWSSGGCCRGPRRTWTSSTRFPRNTRRASDPPRAFSPLWSAHDPLPEPLPATRWESRTVDFGTFGKIQVRLVDALDIIAGKVYSARPKDLDDFRLLSLNLNKEELKERVLQGSSSLTSSDQDRRQATTNWYIVYGDDLGLSSNSSTGDNP